MAGASAYVICTSPRSGSTLLCKMLAATGIAGNPNSHFHVPSLEAWCDAYDLHKAAIGSDADVIGAVIAAAKVRGRGGTHVFGLRLQADSAPFFFEQLCRVAPTSATDTDRLNTVFGATRIIHLKREDKLAQAVSLLKAQQTGLWHRNADGSEMERLSPPQDPSYDREKIAAQIAAFQKHDAIWATWCARQTTSILPLTYESLASDPKGVLACTLAHIGLDPDAAHTVTAPVARLSDAINAEWIMRYNQGA